MDADFVTHKMQLDSSPCTALASDGPTPQAKVGLCRCVVTVVARAVVAVCIHRIPAYPMKLQQRDETHNTQCQHAVIVRLCIPVFYWRDT